MFVEPKAALPGKASGHAAAAQGFPNSGVQLELIPPISSAWILPGASWQLPRIMVQKRCAWKSAAEGQLHGKGEDAAEESRPGNVRQAQDSPTRSQLRVCAKLGIFPW